MSEASERLWPPTAQEQQNQVNDWNTLYRPGQRVRVRLDDGRHLDTVTRSDAWLLGGHTAVVMVEGIAGGYRLERVKAIP